ncbi:MAG: OmpA family protein [Bacteroidota bacterium]
MSEPNYSADEHLKSEMNQYEFDFDPEAMERFRTMQPTSQQAKVKSSLKLGKYFGAVVLLIFLMGGLWMWPEETQSVVANLNEQNQSEESSKIDDSRKEIEHQEKTSLLPVAPKLSSVSEPSEATKKEGQTNVRYTKIPQKQKSAPTAKPIVKSKPLNIPIKLEAVQNIKTIAEGERILLNNIHFEPGSPVMVPESKKEVRLLLQQLQENPSLEIEISGHLCCGVEIRGGDGYDYDHLTWDLSKNRAKRVYEFLVKNGVEKARLTYRGMGLEKPLVFPEKNESDEALNRRVEVKIIKQ